MTDSLPFSLGGRFYKGNLHTHSRRSDGVLEPDEVCAHYRQAGYDFLTLSDHFLERFGYPITDTSAYRTSEFTTLIGAELHTKGTALGELWHILAIGLPHDFAATAPGESGPDLAARAVAAGAFVAIAHPEWNGLTIEDGRKLAPHAHAVEVYNHSSALETDRGDGCFLLDGLASEGWRLGALAVDDSHHPGQDSLGGWVMVKAETPTPEALLAALKAGHYYSSQGPDIENVAVLGDQVEVRCSPSVRVMALGKGWRYACVSGDNMSSTTLSLAPFEDSAWFRVVVIDSHGRRAWTNPIWRADA